DEVKNLASELNTLLFREKMPCHFHFNFLKLNPKKENVEFLSCGGDDIWLFKKDEKRPQKFQSNASELGKMQNADFTPIIVPWKADDECVLVKISSGEEKSSLETTFVKDFVLQNLIASKDKEPKEKLQLL